MAVMHDKIYNTGIERDLIKPSIYPVKDSWFVNGSASPIVSLLKGRGLVEKETNQEFTWLEERPNKVKFTVAPAEAAATELTVNSDSGNTSSMRIGNILKVIKTNEQLVITGINGNKLTVGRGYGETAAAAISEDSTGSGKASIINVSTAFPEGSNAPEGTVITSSKQRNFSQIFKHTVSITRNDLKNPRYTDDGRNPGDRRKRLREKVLKLHQRSIELAILNQEPKEDLTGDMPKYVTGGILYFTKTNRKSYTDPADFNVGSLSEIMGNIADQGAMGDKYLMYGSGFNRILNGNVIKTFGGGAGATITEFGVTVSKIATDFGDLSLVYNQVLSSLFPNMAILLDMDNIRLRAIDDTTLKTNVENPDWDGVKDYFLTDLGLELSNEERHAVITLDF